MFEVIVLLFLSIQPAAVSESVNIGQMKRNQSNCPTTKKKLQQVQFEKCGKKVTSCMRKSRQKCGNSVIAVKLKGLHIVYSIVVAVNVNWNSCTGKKTFCRHKWKYLFNIIFDSFLISSLVLDIIKIDSLFSPPPSWKNLQPQ